MMNNSTPDRPQIFTALALTLGFFSALVLPAAAQSGIFAEGGHDTQQPIEITSDSLEVKQEQQVAIFLGNVDAKQGTLTLTSQRLEVHYTSEETEDGGSSESISSMKASGNVIVTSPTEQAEGEWADYDVVDRVITLHDNVLLTQGKNTLCGASLDMDLDTGRSFLKGACTRSAKNTGGRVQGVFFPSKSKD